MAFAKRALDVTLSGVGLVLSLPVSLAAAAAVKLQDGGPVFFGQERVGKNGRVFRVLKFRSMIPDAEAKVGALQAAAGDTRITKVGHFLRATALDELPQLWNIFRGDMSFVGPRALRPGEIEVGGGGKHEALEDVPGFEERCRVRPGLTGIAQIFAPRDIPRRQKFRYDKLYIRKQAFAPRDIPRRQKFRYDKLYIRKQAFSLDLRLIMLSFWITFRGTWEARGKKF
jgi:lipopolysaccharide/colanic/teichoic acid biosynthesis glycosyltransferase